MADIRVYEDSDLFVFVLLQKEDESGDWVAETNAVKVDIEVFDPEGVTLGTKSLGGEVENLGAFTDEDGEIWGKYRAPFHFAIPGVYRSVSRCEGSGGAKVTTRDMVPVDSL